MIFEDMTWKIWKLDWCDEEKGREEGMVREGGVLTWFGWDIHNKKKIWLVWQSEKEGKGRRGGKEF